MYAHNKSKNYIKNIKTINQWNKTLYTSCLTYNALRPLSAFTIYLTLNALCASLLTIITYKQLTVKLFFQMFEKCNRVRVLLPLRPFFTITCKKLTVNLFFQMFEKCNLVLLPLRPFFTITCKKLIIIINLFFQMFEKCIGRVLLPLCTYISFFDKKPKMKIICMHIISQKIILKILKL